MLEILGQFLEKEKGLGKNLGDVMERKKGSAGKDEFMSKDVQVLIITNITL